MDRIEEFIHRRFPVDCDWMTGNCYFFALIIKSVFSGRLVYDPIDGHFLCNTDGGYYDWTGRRNYTAEYASNFLDWETYIWQEPGYCSRIMRDCML